MARYGLPVFTAWIATGEVFTKRRLRGFTPVVVQPESEWVRAALTSDASSVAGQLVGSALKSFHQKVLLRNVWIPEKGASLTTFYTGWCLLKFDTEYRTWRRERAHESQDVPAGLVVEGFDPTDETADPGRVVVGRYAARDLHDLAVGSSKRESTRQRTETVLPLIADGWTQPEIGDLLGTTDRAVEGQMRRLRDRLPPREELA